MKSTVKIHAIWIFRIDQLGYFVRCDHFLLAFGSLCRCLLAFSTDGLPFWLFEFSSKLPERAPGFTYVVLAVVKAALVIAPLLRF